VTSFTVPNVRAALCSYCTSGDVGKGLAADPVDEERDFVDVAPVPGLAGLE
jgi:hypothetical protein